MAFTFTNYAGIEPQKSPYNDLIGQFLGGYNQTKYGQPGLEEALKKTQLANQYYGPNIESQLALRKAQTGEAGARTGLLGEQTRGARIENQYAPEKIKSQIAEAQASAQKARLIQMIREQLLGGGQVPEGQQGNPLNIPGNANTGQEQVGMFQGQGMPKSTKGPQQTPQQKGGFSYPQAATAMQLLGLGKPQVVDVNGKYMAITPFGNVDTGVQGPNAEEKALQAGMGKYGAKLYGDSTNNYITYQNQGLAINELIDAAESNPQFRNVVGRINQPLTNWFGSAQQKELLGRLSSSSGEIALQVAPSLKGAFTGRDQSLINSIKAGPGDFPDVFIGKLKAQKLINDVLSERSRMTALYIENGMKPLQASQLAAKNTPLDRYRPQINELTSRKKILTPDELAEAKAELVRRG
jgi:hypothetical protein